MISPYSEEMDDEYNTKEYQERTTIAKTSGEVFKYLKKYLKDNQCNSSVRSFIKSYMGNFNALSKTNVVSDGSFRNCVILIRPDGVMVTHGGDRRFESTEEYVTYFAENAEIIFLNMTEETWENAHRFSEMFLNMCLKED